MVDHRTEPPQIVSGQPLLPHTVHHGGLRAEISGIQLDPRTLLPRGARHGRPEATLFQFRLQLLPGDGPRDATNDVCLWSQNLARTW